MSSITGVDAFSKQLEAAGYNTVKIRKGEVNFTGYIGALDKSMQEKMVFTNDQQVQMRNQVAALFGKKNNITHAQLKKLCAQQLGFEVNIGYEKTSYIIDNRNSASKGTEITQGKSVAVLTIKDPKSGQSIKIVDANGNGAIEIEEMFANELLQGISGDLKNAAASGDSGIAAGGASASNPTMTVAIGQGLDKMQEEASNPTKTVAIGQGLDKMQEEASNPTMTIAMGALLEEMENKEFNPEYNPAEMSEKGIKEEAEDISKAQDGTQKETSESNDTTKKVKYEASGYDIVDEAGLRKYAESIAKTEAAKGSKEYEDAVENAMYSIRLSYTTESLSDGTYAILR